MHDAGPRSLGSVHSRNAQTTCFTGVTSTSCTIVGQSGFFTPAVQLQITVLPFFNRCVWCTPLSLIPGSSSFFTSQTTSPLGLTSRTNPCWLPLIIVLPFFRRYASHTLGASQDQISRQSLSYSITLPR